MTKQIHDYPEALAAFKAADEARRVSARAPDCRETHRIYQAARKRADLKALGAGLPTYIPFTV